MAITEADRASSTPETTDITSNASMLPDTPAGQELKWLLGVLNHIHESGIEGLTEEDFVPHWAPPPTPRPPMDPETRRHRWINAASMLGGANIEQMEELSPFEINLV
ncbi:MAG: hypothetical protein ACRD1T_17960, partial [Acidimicrobiia bacterium]